MHMRNNGKHAVAKAAEEVCLKKLQAAAAAAHSAHALFTHLASGSRWLGASSGSGSASLTSVSSC